MKGESMKAIFSLGLTILMAGALYSQDAQTDGPNVEILSYSCVAAPQPNLDASGDVFGTFPNSDSVRSSRAAPLPAGQPAPAPTDREPRLSVENRSDRLGNVESSGRDGKGSSRFMYTAKLKNNSTKTIAAIFWDFQTGDASDQRNLSVRRFRCGEKIKPNESKSLKVLSGPPSRTVKANGSGKDPSQKVIVGRIEYSDGSSWQLSGWEPLPLGKDTPAKSCSELH
jgi:hypothetical protein